MNVIRSLKASADAYLVCGEESAAAMCRRMIGDVESMDAIFGPGAGDALHRNAASELAARAALKLQEFQHGRKVA